MGTNRFNLNVETRTPGRHISRQARMARKIPAVIYGSVKPVSIFLDEGIVKKYNTMAFENALFNIQSDVGSLKGVVALMKDVQVHPVNRRPLHVDLFALDLTKTVRVFIEVRAEGKAIGIAEGGLLNIVNRQVEVECLPTSIPDRFVIDVSNLGIGQSIHASELTLPADVKMISSPEMTLAVCNLAEEEVLTPAAATVDAAAPAAGAAGAAAPAAGAAAPAAAGKDAKAAPAAAKAPAKK